MAWTLDAVTQAADNAKLLSSDQAESIRNKARRAGGNAVDTVSLLGRIPTVSLYHALAQNEGIPFVDVANTKLDTELVKRCPRMLIQRKQILPIKQTSDGIVVAGSNPNDNSSLELLQRTLNSRIQPALADPADLREAIQRSLTDHRETTQIQIDHGPNPVEFLEEIFKEAYVRCASDIHIEPQESAWRVRLRVDGKLYVIRRNIPNDTAQGMVSRAKVLGSLDIAETRKPQDGGFAYALQSINERIPLDKKLDFRIATAPTRHGERVTLRLLGTDTEELTLENLGFSTEGLPIFRRALDLPHGMILITGPTGSGKTTTLYAALREINATDVNILTVEDPIEYPLPGVSQMQLDTAGKLTFAGALRSLLRHDPDVLMIGEIRDGETAEIAVRAALTGHLVFSTLHTNTAPAAVTRLVDIGSPPFLVSSTISLIMAQRLVRRLCPDCRKQSSVSKPEARTFGLDPENAQAYSPVGCVRCLNTGYKGRIGVFEIFNTNDDVRNVVTSGGSEVELIQAAGSDCYQPMKLDLRNKIQSGLTSIAEARTILVEGN